MRFRLRVIVLCIGLLLLSGCQPSEKANVTTEPSTVPINTLSAEDARYAYQQALDKLSALKDYTLNITISKTTSVGKEVFSETRHQVLKYRQLGTKHMQAALEETCINGSLHTSVSEYYDDNTSYFIVNGNHFKSDITPQAYIARNIPAALLDVSLYESISAQESGGEISIWCNQPTQGESFVFPSGAKMTAASGTVLLDKTGSLAKSTYDLTYVYGSACVEYSVTVQVDPKPVSDIQIPENDFKPLTYPDAPRMLEQACGYLLQSKLLSANVTSSITCQAGGIHRVETAYLQADSLSSDFSAVLDTSVNVVDYSRGGETTLYTQTETFADNQYSIAIDNGNANAKDEITAEVMQTYCQDLLVSSVLLPDYIADAAVTDLGSVYLLELTAPEEFALILTESASQTLYGDPQFLSALASSSQIGTAECYLAIDKYTGLPTAAGYSCNVEYTIEDFTYTFHTQTDAAYHLASLTTQADIAGSQDTAERSTPLFYHITGEQGQSLWLLGVLPFGDERSCNLPQAIYDAFAQADVFVAEYTLDTQSYTDHQLQSTLSQARLYEKHVTANHLEAELYETGRKLMKASGCYTADTDRSKPIFWEAQIADFYLQQGYWLTSAQSVVSHLMQQAEAAKKEISYVESPLERIQKLGNLSDSLQAALLDKTVSCNGFAYHTDAAKLFDFWCAGDKAALQSWLSANLNLSDVALNNEYTDAFLTQPNAAMLSIATDYLNSGKTVFLAVGIEHLLGDSGLMTALQNAGYSVTQVTYP